MRCLKYVSLPLWKLFAIVIFFSFLFLMLLVVCAQNRFHQTVTNHILLIQFNMGNAINIS